MALIQLRERAKISDQFKERMVQIYKTHLVNLKKEIDCAPASVGQKIQKDNTLKIVRLLKLVNDPSVFDAEITKIRSLDYSFFDVAEYDSKIFLYGKTKTVIIHENNGRSWDMGEYGIYVPLDKMLGSGGGHGIERGEWHFVPFRDPKTRDRTPHHTGGSRDSHPLSVQSSTCWGSFGHTIPSILADGDISELYRALSLYITRYDPGSPLTHFRNCSHRREV